MKYKLLDSLTGLVLGCVMVAGANAGWGSSGGYYGGSTGYGSYGGYAASYGSYGSSGGYAVGYGSSGYAASYGSSGGYAASYGSSGGYAGYSSYRGGILHRVANHIHDHFAAKRARHLARRANYASYGSSGGYVASYGSSGGYSGYGSSGGYSTYHSVYSGGSSGGAVNYGSTGATSYGSVGGAYYGASTSSAKPYSFLAASPQANDDAVYLTVSVPSDALVYVNGNLTSSQGTLRQFVSRGLEADKSYRFQIRAELEAADGQLLNEEREIVVQAGQNETLQFAFAESRQPIETAITLNVPEDAQVRLAGSPTKVTGESRIYRTQRLLPGEVWDDYEIEVTRGDQVKKQKIRLIAGDKLQLTFNFDETPDRLAAR